MKRSSAKALRDAGHVRGGGAADVVDAVVLGGGMAGLQAAGKLLAAGLSVVLLEARGRLGGRIDSRCLPGWPGVVEAGAEFVHGRPPPLIAALERAGAHLVPIPQQHHIARRGVVGAANRSWKKIQATLEKLPATDTAFSAAARRSPAVRALTGAERRLLENFVEGFNAADAGRVSMRGLARQADAEESEGGDRLFRLRDGYQALIEHLAAPLRRRSGVVRLGAIVSQVRWGTGGVQVRARAAWGGFLPDVRARVALVTLPLGVLQAPPRSLGGVRFVPLLPAEKRAAISALGMGSVVKLVVRFRASLTSALAPSLPADACFIHAPRAPVPTWWRPLPLPPTVMVGWVGGPAAARFATGDSRRPEIRRQMVERALRGLARELGMSPLALCNSVEDAQVFDWAADPFARGAYSWVPVGALNAGAALAAAVDGCLFFAGEACDSDGDPGTVHGALASGARAATEIIRRTRQLRR